MRPVRLSLEGFTSFKEPVTLDFSALDLFVIHGATGAGKSSLLDALTYALYGKVPRSEGRGGIAEFISLGKKRATTSLEFALRDERYRVTRTASRGKKGVETKALLERLRGGDFVETVAEGVSRVDGVLADKLHMPFDVFTQAVLLPQGQFATFLRSAPRERRQMLNELLQLQVFERMHKQASTRKGELETQLAGLVRRIEEDFAGVSREAFEESQVRIAETETASERVQKALAARRTEHGELRRRFVLHQEWAASQESLRGLVAREPAMAVQEVSLRRARAARSILPMLDEALRDRSDHEALQRETERLKEAFETARIRYREIQAEREAADDAAEEVPALEKRRLRLAEIAGKVAHRMSLDENRTAAAESLAKKRTKSAELVKLLAKLDADEKAGRRELAKLVGERRPLPADVDDRLKRGHELTAKLMQDRQDLARRVEERRQLESQCEAGAVAVDTTGRRRRDAEAKLLEAERSLAEAIAERERRRHASLVDELRRELRAGDDCPVCGQAVEHLPACATIATVADDVAKLEKRTTKLRAEASKAAAEALVAESDRDRLSGQTAEIDGFVKRQRASVAGLEADLGRVLTSPSANGSIETTFAAWADEIRQTRERHDRIGRDEAILTEKLAGIDRNRAATRTSIVEIDAEIRDGDARLAELERSLKSLDAEIAGITTHADPRAESEEIGRTIEARKSALARTQKEEALRAQAMEVARTERDRHQAETKKATARAAESARRADESLREADFEDVASARAALRSPADIEELDSQLTSFRRDLDAVRRRIAELDVGGTPVDAGQVAVLENDVKALERESQELLTTLVRHQESARRLERELLRQEEVERDRAATNRRLTVYRQLTDDLKSDRFQAYMLEETLADLVRGASDQLGQLTSQRFGLCFEEDAIRVVDLDNAGEVRSADTLSGGETFLASLALALELSAQVQRAVGAVSLDCLFIDEGFGTLDPDSIALVADSIRGLQVGGRMVGIITHLPDFIEQFDQRVFVEKSAGVSSLRVETVEA